MKEITSAWEVTMEGKSGVKIWPYSWEVSWAVLALIVRFILVIEQRKAWVNTKRVFIVVSYPHCKIIHMNSLLELRWFAQKVLLIIKWSLKFSIVVYRTVMWFSYWKLLDDGEKSRSSAHFCTTLMWFSYWKLLDDGETRRSSAHFCTTLMWFSYWKLLDDGETRRSSAHFCTTLMWFSYWKLLDHGERKRSSEYFCGFLPRGLSPSRFLSLLHRNHHLRHCDIYHHIDHHHRQTQVLENSFCKFLFYVQVSCIS